MQETSAFIISPQKTYISPQKTSLFSQLRYNVKKRKGLVNMKSSGTPKIITAILVICALVGGWYFLFFPERINQETVTESFEKHENAMQTVAEYLVSGNISTKITGFFTIDENYGVEKTDDDSYSEMISAVEELLTKEYTEIISDGKTVEFVYRSTGGKFRKLYGSVIYNGEKKVEGKVTVPLTTDGWHLYIAQG